MEVETKKDDAPVKAPFAIWVAVRRSFPVDSPFFAAGNVERELLAKQISLEITEEEKKHIVQSEEEQLWQLCCPIVGCGIKLKGIGELESHYLSRHSATCSVCAQVFPTTRLLNLHVSETHDSFFQAKVARNYPMYECLVQGCGAKFLSDSSRHQHLVDKHHFPRSFRFHVKKHASQKQRQRQKATPSKTTKNVKAKNAPDAAPATTTTALEIQMPQKQQMANDETQMDVDELVTAVSRLSTVSSEDSTPTVLSFGHRRGRGLQRSQRRGGRGKNGEPPSPAPAAPL